MVDDISRILDDCLTRIANGEEVTDCLSDYNNFRHELESLLQTALLVKKIPSVKNVCCKVPRKM